ncbi:UBC-like protein [Gigaspora margarita]|uniref:Ubiquitin-conjugating enzyme E2 6 n=1 Tax=Gigaspora margarita TaxID=4874 RepID=A0A8H4EJI8_GIGMA|nr:UBC-like protein [Gigaspora margarita]
MATKAAYKRLTKEYLAVQKNPPPYMIAKPLEKNILEWHYVLRGPPDTPYHNGEYHGVLLFPPEYPFKPPSIRMTTPSGRFQPDTRLCLSMSDFHPSTWNPSWSVATILTGLLSFMTSNEATTGSIKTTDADKKIYAARSHQFNLNDPKFREYFPELCIPEAVPVEILYPISSSSSTPTQTSTEITESVNPVLPTPQRNDLGMVNQRLIPAAKNQTLQRKVLNRVENPTIRGIAEHANNTARVNANNPQINNINNNNNNNNNNVGQRRILDQWRKWIILSLVCLYLVIIKLLARSESVSGSEAS